MIQFNLLPDVKLEYIRARRSQRLVFGVAGIVTAISVAILLVVVSIGLAEKKHLSDVNKNIASESSDLQKKPQIDKILTVQNQLESLQKLHDTKLASSRLLDYINQVTPAEDSITELHVDFVTFKVAITGKADSLSNVNTYIDTLKFTTYNVPGGDTKNPPSAFKDVVMTSFLIGTTENDGPKTQSTYGIDFTYDPLIFDITQNVTLKVPDDKITTRSELEKPTDLFIKSPDAVTNGGSR